MKPAVILAAVLAAAAPALAQEERSAYRTPGAAYDEIEVDWRFIFPGGDALPGTSWSDFWETGSGIRLGLNHVWATSDQVDVGISVSLGYDRLFGTEFEEFDPGLNETLSYFPDALAMVRLQAGVFTRFRFEPAWLDFRLAFGGALYMSTDVTVISPSLDVTFEAIASTFTYCFALEARFGVDVSAKTAIAFGVSFDLVGAPDPGSGFAPDTPIDPQTNVALTLGAEFRL